MARKRTRKINTKRESRGREEKQKNSVDPRIREEVILIFICLFALLLFLSNLGFCGVLGELLRQVQFILCGRFSFLFPFLLLFTLIYYVKNKEKPGLVKSLLAIVLLYLLTESFFSTIFLGKEIPEDFFSLLEGGGVPGNGILFLLSLLLVFFILLSLVFITEKPLMSLFATFSVHTAEKAGRRAKEDFRKISGSAKEALRERRERREVKGVDFSATDLHLEDFPSEEREEDELRLLMEELYDDTPSTEAEEFSESPKAEDFSFDLPLDTGSDKEILTMLWKRRREEELLRIRRSWSEELRKRSRKSRKL